MEANEVTTFQEIGEWLAMNAESSGVLGYWEGFWQGIRQVLIEQGIIVVPVENFTLAPEPTVIEIAGVKVSAYHLQFFMGDGEKFLEVRCAFSVNSEGRITTVSIP